MQGEWLDRWTTFEWRMWMMTIRKAMKNALSRSHEMLCEKVSIEIKCLKSVASKQTNGWFHSIPLFNPYICVKPRLIQAMPTVRVCCNQRVFSFILLYFFYPPLILSNPLFYECDSLKFFPVFISFFWFQ